MDVPVQGRLDVETIHSVVSQMFLPDRVVISVVILSAELSS
jgi:hypothetical protein